MKTKHVLGLWNMGNAQFHKKLSSEESKRIIKVAISKGITSFDSAFSYREADSLLYSALKAMNTKREDVEIISKVMPVDTLEKKVAISLKRLNSDYLDALLLHWPSEIEAVYSSLKKLEKLKESGKVMETGVSNFPISLLEKVCKDFQISIHERPLSLIWSRDYEEEKKLGIKLFTYAPLGMGVLAKKEEPDDERRRLYIYKDGKEEYKELKCYLSELSKRHNVKERDIAISWVLEQNPDAIIFGASEPEQLSFSDIELTKDELSTLSELSARLNSKATSDNIFSHNYLIN